MVARKNNAPPQILVLLWHHFCYYKRHWIKLVITILLPFLFLAPLIWLVRALSNGDMEKPSRYRDCQFLTKSPFSAGPLQAALSSTCESQIDRTFWQSYGSRKRSDPYNDVLETCVTYGDRNVLDMLLSGEIPTCLEGGGSFGNGFYGMRELCPACGRWYQSSKLCLILQQKILYFPKTHDLAEPVMNHVIEMLKDYISFFDDGPANPTEEMPPFLELFRNGTPPRNGKPQHEQTKTGNSQFLQLIQSIISQYRNCSIDPTERVLGFNSREEVLEYTRDKSKNGSRYQNFVPNLWGIISFEDEAATPEDHLKYRIIYDSQSSRKIYTHIPLLQDLVENAIIWHKNGGKKPPVAIGTKALPHKCWITPSIYIFATLGMFIQAVAVFSFIMSPSNFLEQVLTEKSLKLREYLYIMGVGDLTLKFSWILFYIIFLVPLSIAFALVIVYMPGQAFGRSDTSLVFVLVILYNICQLSFCYLLACALKKPRRTGILILFLNGFFWFMSSFLFGGADLKGASLILARVCCLYCVTPMAIGFSYMVRWEAEWVGARWGNFFYSPNIVDQFSGFGECFLWLLGDTIMYLVVAWYLERVMPGEFGVKQPLYFFLQPSYWFPSKYKNRYKAVAPEEQADVESPPNGAEAGVTLTDLTKMYGREKIGVNKLSLRFYKHEVTAFLGENGAGKSTTMNTLVGLISATGGKAMVHKFDTHTQMSEVRKIVGFVPQYDILYPSMTVQEHLQFFGWLKGLSKAETKKLTEPFLTKLDLEKQKNNITTNLSGGQKRKLSVLTAYLGDPEVVILDEPTSGVDPFSRRAIWEMILSRRKTGTTILSTHFMEEADILGDRIAIIANGELRCSGTPMYLKNKYGKGLRLIAACNPGTENKNTLKQFFAENIPESRVLQQKGSDVIFAIPVEVGRSRAMVDFLRKFEEHQSKLSVTSYGLSEPTLEEVFFSATESQYDVYNDSADMEPKENGGGIELMEKGGNANPQTSDQISYPKADTFTKILWQAWGLMQKRAFYTVLSWSGYLLQIALPLAFIVLLLLIGKQVRESKAGVRDVHIWQHYRDNVVFFQDSSDSVNPYISSAVSHGLEPRCPLGLEGFSCDGFKDEKPDKLLTNPANIGPFSNCSCSSSHCSDGDATDQPNELVKSEDKIYRIGSETDLSQWMIRANSSYQTPVGGFQFMRMNATNWNNLLLELENQIPEYRSWIDLVNKTTPLNYVNVWHKTNLELGMLNVWSNLALKHLTSNSAGIKMELESTRLVDISRDIEAQIMEYFSLLLSSIFLDFCFAFGTFGIAVFVQYENSTGLKRLQFLFGANPIIYWTVNLICDFLLYMVTVGIVMIFLSIFENSFKDDLGPILAVVIPYGYLSITFIYLLSFLFKGSQGIVVFTAVSFVVLLFAAMTVSVFEIITTVCQKMCEGNQECIDERCSDFPWAAPVASVLRIIPAYYISDGVTLIVIAQIVGNLPFIKENPFEPLLGMDYLGRRIFTAYFVGTAYFAIVLILESLDVRMECQCCQSNEHRSGVNPMKLVDSDVQAEEFRVNQDPNLQDPLVLRNLSKTYSGANMPAVAGVTLGVPRSQCFGLLGINGAGKTTLFRMLTGFLRPTSGGAVLEGKDLFTRGWGRLAGASYCPQENTLFDSLSVSRHLTLFAMIRGIPTSHQSDVINCLVKEVGLTPHLGKKAAELSGGNQRKLQFAMSLLDYCPVIFLDEPTTGMDPSARRNAWDLIKTAVDKQCSVVLTSHSMEECEALCHRLVIMVAGSFQCIGSVQYLKDKFGNKYTYKIKMSRNENQESPSESIKSFMMAQFPTSTLTEEHSSMLHFEVPAAGLMLSDLFTVLNQCREQFPIEDFAVSQTTLEHVFINMAKMQEIVQSGFIVQQAAQNAGIAQGFVGAPSGGDAVAVQIGGDDDGVVLPGQSEPT